MTETKNPNEYEFLTFKTDRRTKKGEKLVDRYTKVFATAEDAQTYFERLPKKVGERVECHQKWVVRKNLLSGKEFYEAWDTPDFCSPSSESYWSM